MRAAHVRTEEYALHWMAVTRVSALTTILDATVNTSATIVTQTLAKTEASADPRKVAVTDVIVLLVPREHIVNWTLEMNAIATRVNMLALVKTG